MSGVMDREFSVGNNGGKFFDLDSHRKFHTQKSDNQPVGVNPSVHLRVLILKMVRLLILWHPKNMMLRF